MNRITFIILICVTLSSALRGVRKTRSVNKRAAGGGCMYEGQVYQQGQTWTKQCQVNCVCQDGSTGLYKCTDICPSYGTLPKQCHMVQQPNSCCSKPECSFQASTSGGDGQGMGTLVTNGGQNGMGTMTGGATTCQNKRTDCENYGQSVCTNTQYTQWVIENCPAFCNKCGMTGTMTGGTMTGTMTGGTGGMTSGTGGMTGGTGGMTSGTGGMTGGTGGMTGGTYVSGTCVDAIQNCAAYGASVCSDQQYTQWTLKNCQKTCNKCGWLVTGTSGTGSVGGTGVTGGGALLYPVPVLGGSGGMTGGTGGMTGGTGGMTSGTGGMTGGTGGMTGGTGTMPGGTGGMTGGTGGMTGGTYVSGPCTDKLDNCKAYGATACSDAKYDQWAKTNCALTCNKCGGTVSGSGTLTGTGTGSGTVTGTGGSGGTYLVPGGGTGTGSGTVTGTGTGGSGGPYLVPGGGSGTGSGTVTGTGGSGGTYLVPGGSGSETGTGTGTGGTGGTYYPGGTGGTGTGTGSGTVSGTGGTGGTYVPGGTGGTGSGSGSGSVLGTGGTGGTYVPGGSGTMTGTGTGTGTMTGTGTGTGTMTGTGGGYLVPGGGTSGGTYYPGGTGTGGTGTMTGTGSGTMTGNGGMTGGTYTGPCVNALSNCEQYGQNVCSDPKYTSWAQKNCPAYCGMCSSGSGTMTSGSGGGGSSVYTGSGSGQATSGQSSGCVYKGQVYQQGQSWKDGCSFRCSCDDGSQGRYTCKQLCVNWSLPNACSLNEPAPGKCCKTPNCPPSVQLTYPPNYVAE